MTDVKTLDEITRTIDGSEFVRLATIGANWKTTVAALGNFINAGSSATFFDIRSDAVAASIPSSVQWLGTAGYYSVGDGGGTIYKKVGATSPGGFQSADGAWWQIVVFNNLLNAKCFGVTGNGTTDDLPNFQHWAAAALLMPAPVTLLIPPGDYSLSDNGRILRAFGTGNDVRYATIYAYGANFIDNLFIGANSIAFLSNVGSYLFQSTNGANAKSIAMVTPAEAGNFAADDWVWLSCLDLQSGGFPPNNYYNEFAQIESVDTGTGIITFHDFLHNNYKSTYPSYSPGSPSTQNQGGPATIWALSANWDADITIYGLTYSGGVSTNNTFCNLSNGMRKSRLVDCRFLGTGQGSTATPSFVKQAILENCYFFDFVENDKGAENVKYSNCFFNSALITQSASVDCMHVDNCVFAEAGPSTGGAIGIEGTSRNMMITNCRLPRLTIGPSAFGIGYGATEKLQVENSRIGKIVGVFSDGTSSPPDGIADWTLNHGTLSRPKSLGPAWWAVPGAAMFVTVHARQPEDNHGTPFRVLDVSVDGNSPPNTLVKTTLGNAFVGAAIDRFQIHPCANVTFRSVSGCQRAESLSKQTPGMPFLSYAERTYIGAVSTSNDPNPQLFVWGFVSLLQINVARPYTGVSGTLTMTLTLQGVDAAGALQTLNETIDLKTAGIRQITATTTAGSTAGDTLVPFPSWIGRKLNSSTSDAITLSYSADISAETIDLSPIVDIEISTDQGVTNYSNIRVSGGDIIAGTTANTPAAVF